MINPSPLLVQGIIQDIQENDYGEFYFRKDVDRYIAHRNAKYCEAMADRYATKEEMALRNEAECAQGRFTLTEGFWKRKR